MRKIVAGFACSLDGYIAGPRGEYDWILIDKEIDFAAQRKRYDAFLMGRKSYEAVSAMSNKPTPGISNYVFSNTLTTVPEHYKVISGDIKPQVEALKQAKGKDIAVFGGASLLTSLLDIKMVDELSVSIIPVLLGQGKPLVNLLKEKVWLTLANSRRYGNGTLQIDYTVSYKLPGK